MKLYRNAIILVVVIALLGGVYYFVNKNKGSSGNAANTSTSTDIKLTDYISDNIESVTIKDKEGIMVIAKKGTDWIATTPANFNGDSSKLSNIVVSAASVSAQKIIADKVDNLSQYGLSDPSVVTIKAKNAAAIVLNIGSATPTKDNYYVMVEGNIKLYMVSSYTVEQLLAKRNDLRNKTLFTFKSTDLIDFGMDRKGQSVFTSRKAADNNWNMLTPIQGNVNSSAVSPMLDAIANTTVSEYVEDNPADLGKYGLANPSYAFEFSTSSGKFKLLLGDEKTKGSLIYAKLDGKNEVFTIDESAYTFLDKPLKEIVDVFAYLVNIDQVNKLELTMDGQTTTMGIEIFKDASGKSDTDKDKFTVNGKEAIGKDKNDKQPFRTFYESLIGISLDDVNSTAVPSGTPEITIKYYLKSAPGTMTVDFVPKDSNYYYVVRNGKYAGIVVRKDRGDMGVAGMRDAYKALMNFVNTAQK
jgi:hypothetical protein